MRDRGAPRLPASMAKPAGKSYDEGVTGRDAWLEAPRIPRCRALRRFLPRSPIAALVPSGARSPPAPDMEISYSTVSPGVNLRVRSTGSAHPVEISSASVAISNRPAGQIRFPIMRPPIVAWIRERSVNSSIPHRRPAAILCPPALSSSRAPWASAGLYQRAEWYRGISSSLAPD